MELDETNNHLNSKRLRNTMAICNGSVSKLEEDQQLDEESRKRLMPWSAHPSSRIYRVSRASGGKDRHSKVYTAKGIRDRRVRLSVSTAIQFYDLQDRLGYDQPSKAIEWLIKAASNAIDKLPSLDHSSFPTETLMHSNNKLARVGSDEPDLDQTGFNNNQLAKSTCSSTSETSKGSVLSLSRSENRVKARERARERTKDKEKSQDETPPAHHAPAGGASFTELLTGASSHGCTTGPSSSVHLPTAAVLTTADYFKINQNHHNNHHNSHNNAQMQHIFSPQVYGNFAQMINFPPNPAGSPAGDHTELHQYSFLQENNLIPVAQLAPAGDNYNLNFSISSNNNNNNNLVGVNSRGTLQSNSSSQIVMPRLVSSQLDGSSLNLPFFFGPGAPAGAPNSATSAAENQYIQFWDGYRQHHASDLKEKGKN
ncbi:hypothetical protein LUZ60_010308 [Juncus effusus]|nr:hypothetical protein LUZ60_010308 [Juncus effusus]